jgi:microcystin degradation protein MlrC
MRLAVGALLFEGNTFSPVVSERCDFAAKYLCEGDAILAELSGTGTEIAGALDVARARRVSIVPLLATHGGAGGRVSQSCYAVLKASLLSRLAAAGALDGVYLALHGAFVAEGTDDVEADILAAVRSIVGAIPVVVSCDLHAHVTETMLRLCDALIGYQHYPHDDTYETGQRCMQLLVDIVDGSIKPVMRACRAPMIVPAQRQRTRGDGPGALIFNLARSLETASIRAVSHFWVQPWMDLAEMGFTAVVVGTDATLAASAADRVARTAWQIRNDLLVETHSPAEAIGAGAALDGLVVLVDAADCVGGGASGDSAVVLAALLRHAPDAPAAIHIVDPETVAEAQRHDVGERFIARLGNKLDKSYGAPVQLEVTLVSRSVGRFTYSGGLMRGVEARMGATAVLRAGAVEILVASLSAYEYADEAFAANGIATREKKFVVVKNPMNYQTAYADAAASFILDTPGPTTANLETLSWRRLDRPTFPIDAIFEPRFVGFPA